MWRKAITLAIFSCQLKNTTLPPWCASSNTHCVCLILVSVSKRDVHPVHHIGMKSLFLSIMLIIPLASALDLTPQAGISLERYLGRWYEQARFENWFEKGMEKVYTDYTMGPDASINVVNSGLDEMGNLEQSKGRAFPAGNGMLEVSFVWPYWWFRAPYRILYVDDQYRAALVSGDDDKYLWLLTREKKPAPAMIDKLKQEAQRRGFDTTKLRPTRQ